MRGAEAGHIALVTKHGAPVFVALPFDDTVMEEGVRVALAIKLFDEEVVSLSQAAKVAGTTVGEMIDLLGARGIPVARYSADEIEDDLRAVR